MAARRAQLLGISLRATYRAIEGGHIPAIRLGRRIRVPTAPLEHLLGIRPNPDSAPTRGSSRRADMATTYFLVSWVDHHARDKGQRPTLREYGTAGSKQAAIRLAERVLPPGAEYIVSTLHRTVHEGRTPEVYRGLGRGI